MGAGQEQCCQVNYLKLFLARADDWRGMSSSAQGLRMREVVSGKIGGMCKPAGVDVIHQLLSETT